MSVYMGNAGSSDRFSFCFCGRGCQYRFDLGIVEAREEISEVPGRRLIIARLGSGSNRMGLLRGSTEQCVVRHGYFVRT
jgi:hypothetical protein